MNAENYFDMMEKLFLQAGLLFIFSINAAAQAVPEKVLIANNGIERPRLVVGLVIDQMRWDYLYRYYSRYGNGGFKRLLKEGFSFENTFIPYTPTVTSAGHSSLYSGSVPAIHGIVNNDWVERESGEDMYCTADKTVNTVGSFSKQGQMSPRNLLVTTIGDELRLATNFKSRVFGIAIKDRGGILAAGHSANASYWYDDSTGNWITSSYYMNELPVWVRGFNESRKVDSMMMIDWNPLYDLSTYEQSTRDNSGFERTFAHETNTVFPHKYRSVIGKNYFPFRESVYGNTFTLDFSTTLLKKEKLGKSGQTDMLCVSLSSTDYIGHKYGPNSIEVEDMYLRLDKDIENFLNQLDAEVGAGNYLLFLSADHGVPQAPGFMTANNLAAGNLVKADLKNELNQFCLDKFAVKDLVKAIHEYQVYFNNQIIQSSGLDKELIKEAIILYLLQNPAVTNAFDYAAIDKVILPKQLKEKFANGYYYKRSGDIQFILKPQYTDKYSIGTEHGTMYAYDTHIPLIWYGWKIKPGTAYREVSMTDVAPTISSLLKIQMPNGSIGQVLEEILK